MEKEKLNIHLIEDELDFVHKERKVQRYAAVVMFLFLAAGLLGFFGGGVVSKTRISLNGFEVEYQQYLRESTSSEFFVYLEKAADTTVISFNKKYLEKIKINEIVPQPVSTKTNDNRIFYTFNTGGEGVIIFYLMPLNGGSRELVLGIGGEIKQIKQFVYY
ncbi:MAG TPA: hypothetical protein VF181_12770 [Balneolaceae bacterium]